MSRAVSGMKTQSSGKLFVFEGPDGVGKSTIVARLQHELTTGIESVVIGAFPGNAPGSLGRHVYELHHNPERFGVNQLRPDSLQLLHIAAHLDAIHSWIAAARESGKTVLLDRFWWSTYVYGIAAGLPEGTIATIVGVELPYWRSHPPNAVFLVNRPSSKGSTDTALASAYRNLANREREFTPVHELVNDNGVEAVARRVISQMQESDAS
jgi:thymidylate kinase